MQKPKIAVYKFTSCDGCELTLLEEGKEFLELSRIADVTVFREATSRSYDPAAPVDIALIDGSISTARDRERIVAVRKTATTLVSLGACAMYGGVQALRNDHLANGRDKTWLATVYPEPPYGVQLERSTPVSAHVHVDISIPGCPVDTAHLFEVLSAALHRRPAAQSTHALCIDCKAEGYLCVMVAYGEPCMGPVTQTGCGAICPSHARGCYGCFGPSDAPQEGLLKIIIARQGKAALAPTLTAQTYSRERPPIAKKERSP